MSGPIGVAARSKWTTALAGMRERRAEDHPAIVRLQDKIRRHRAEELGAGGS